METLFTKKSMRVVLRTTLLSIGAIFFLIIALMGLGTLAEDNGTTAAILAHFFAKSLIACFAFFAAKIPLLVLVKWTTINGWFSVLLWREALRPASVKPLFTFSTEAVYYNKDFSWNEIFAPFIQGCKRAFKFFSNPLTLIIASIKVVENLFVFALDLLPPRVAANAPSSVIYRVLKGLMVLLCELCSIFLTFFEPIASIPYYIVYFIVITIPDFIMWLFFEFKVETVVSPGAIVGKSKEQPLSLSNTAQTAKYISQKLLYPEAIEE